MRLLFVCLGNICRSPTAEGVMRTVVAEAGLQDSVELDSAGTGAWHVGSPPDARASATAQARGIELRGAARQVDERATSTTSTCCSRWTLEHATTCSRSRPTTRRARRCGCCASSTPRARTPRTSTSRTPTTGAAEGFEEVLDLVLAACDGLLARDCAGVRR